MRNKGELFIFLTFAAIGVYVLIEIATRFVALGIAGGGGRDNAALFPGILAVLLLIVTAMKLAMTLRRPTPIAQVQEPATTDGTDAIRAPGSIRTQVWLLVLVVGYVVLLDVVGYIVTTPIALFLMFRLLGVRRPGLNALVSAATTLVVWYVFSELMRIPMPPGRFGLYL